MFVGRYSKQIRRNEDPFRLHQKCQPQPRPGEQARLQRIVYACQHASAKSAAHRVCGVGTSKVLHCDEHSSGKEKTMGTILLIILILLLIGALPAWPYSSGWGYWPSGGLGLILLILIILALTGHL
jgi:Protein of unknown function (DUF3309)